MGCLRCKRGAQSQRRQTTATAVTVGVAAQSPRRDCAHSAHFLRPCKLNTQPPFGGSPIFFKPRISFGRRVAGVGGLVWSLALLSFHRRPFLPADILRLTSYMVSCRMATDDTPMPTYGFLTYNVQDGFNEAVLRGFRSGILTQVDYNNLEQCEQIDGARKPVGQIFVSPF